MWFKKKLPTSISIPDLYKLTANVGSYSSTINLILQYENAVDILIVKSLKLMLLRFL